MSAIDKINRDVLQLWEKHKDIFDDNASIPLIYPELKSKIILFIGLNPSSSKKGFKNLKKTEFNDIGPDDLLWKNWDTLNLGKMQKMEKIQKESYPYFNKFNDISKKIFLAWEHIDLFFYRETNQKKLVGRIFKKREELTDFGQEQLIISKELVKLTYPKIIVVVNALAAKIFCNQFNPSFDDQYGYYLVNLEGVEHPIPLFLTSILTGQRALDNFSYERLVWHIKQALRNQ